jgi:hypothetical protein
MKMNDHSKDLLIEQPAITLFAELGWEIARCFSEFDDGKSLRAAAS